MEYIPGIEIKIAEKIVALSDIYGNIMINLIGGEPLLARDIDKALNLLLIRKNIRIRLFTNLSFIYRIEDSLSRLSEVIVSLHVPFRTDEETDKMIDDLNRLKKIKDLTLTQLDYRLTDDDWRKIRKIQKGTGLDIDFQTYILPVTEIKEDLFTDEGFKPSLNKYCSLGYMAFFIKPNANFYYDLWCDGRFQKEGNFLETTPEGFSKLLLEGMRRCPRSTCGCNYNYFYYDEYQKACKELKYNKKDTFLSPNVNMLERIKKRLSSLKARL